MNERDATNAENQLSARVFWDGAAGAFDAAPDHGLADPTVHAAWSNLLQLNLPPCSSTVLDIGCGTGTLSLLLADLGHRVTGIDISPAMLDRAQQKAQAAGRLVSFHLMDGSAPDFPLHSFDVALCRHVLWALGDPQAVLTRWAKLLKPDGVLLLIEGRWHTGAGMAADEVLAVMPPTLTNIVVQPLAEIPALWGRAVADERYLIRAVQDAVGDAG